jgi:hypothetical protein
MSLSRKLQQLRISKPRRRRLILNDLDNETVQFVSNGSVFGLVENGGLHRVQRITHTDFGNQARVTLLGNGIAWNFDLPPTELQKLREFSPIRVA